MPRGPSRTAFVSAPIPVVNPCCPTPPQEDLHQILLSFTVRFPGGYQCLCRIPRLGSLMWGWEPWQQWENFVGIIVLQFVGHLPGGYGIWFYCDCALPTVSLWLLHCLWTWGMFFWCVSASSCQCLFNS